MEEELRLADAVIVVSTPRYVEKANARQGGAGFEGQIISANLFRGARTRYIPLVVTGASGTGPEDYPVPTFLEGVAAIRFHADREDEASYEELLRTIFDRPRFVPPPLGEPPTLLSDSDLEWGSRGGRRVPAALDYTSPLSLDFGMIAGAVDAIQALSSPAAWEDFHDTAPDRLWMKSASDSLIGTLYALWAPMAHYELERSSWERRFAGFDWRSKLQFLLIEAVASCYRDDDVFAGLAPVIPYTPRVRGWRERREAEPARYWWQGLSEERWRDAAAQFMVRDGTGSPRLMSGAESRQHYRALFAGGSDDDQRALGLAANALFRFTTFDRPVYWRLLVCQSLLYHALLRTRSETLGRPESPADLLALARPIDDVAFPLGPTDPLVETFEPMTATVDAARAYIGEVVAYRLLRRLR